MRVISQRVAAFLVVVLACPVDARHPRRNRHENTPSPPPSPSPEPQASAVEARKVALDAEPIAPAVDTSCEDDAAYRDADGFSCKDYEHKGWCSASYFLPGFEGKGEGSSPGPGGSCCACGKGRGGCLQARIDQYCITNRVGVAARKQNLHWNCYASLGALKAVQCVDAKGLDGECLAGVGPAADPTHHDDQIRALLREGCVSKAEQERRKAARVAAKHEEAKAHAKGEVLGSCIQEAMDKTCSDAFQPGAVSRRLGAQYVCCSKTLQVQEDDEQALACVDANGYFTECSACDTSDASTFKDMSKDLRQIMWQGCREAKSKGKLRMDEMPAAAPDASLLPAGGTAAFIFVAVGALIVAVQRRRSVAVALSPHAGASSVELL